MQTDYINMIEPTPKFKSKRCKTISFFIKIFLQYATPLSALIAWYIYDYFIAGAVLILTFIIMGIIRSKIRNSSIPINQREYQYNDKGIADWFTSLEFCIEEKDL